MERISKAVSESRPFSSTRREIRSGFSSTSLCVEAEPMVVTIPSPTAGDDRFLASTTDQAVDIGAHGHSAGGLDLNAVFGNRRNQGRVDHLGIDADFDRIEHIAARQVDAGRALKAQIDVGLVGRD